LASNQNEKDNTMTNTSEKQTNKPVFRKKLPGGISTAVFEHERDGKTYRSVNLQRSYKQKGEWKRMSIYLDHADIPFMIEALQGTWQFLNEFPIGGHAADAEPAEAAA
jgi:hypothetical protein